MADTSNGNSPTQEDYDTADEMGMSALIIQGCILHFTLLHNGAL